jgi:F-type H+-transporting ATPase subunit delta
MPNPRLAARYAKSLVDLAIERKQLEEVYADMTLLDKVCHTNRDFVNLLRSPIVKTDTKKKIMVAIISGKVSVLTQSFITLLISKGRESNLPEIIQSFISQYKAHKNIHIVKLATAMPISDAIRNAVVTQVKEAGGFTNIELEEQVDDSLVGGFVLQVGDKLVDASIAYDLKTIARQFENNDFIYKIR